MINIAMGLLRHILTLVGGYLAAKFALEPSVIDGAIAAIVTIVGIVWSIVAKQPYSPDVGATGPVGSTAGLVPVDAGTAPLAILGDPVKAARAVDAAPYGYRKDGKPRSKSGKKPSNKKK